ncbi:hypothetical protein T4C_8985 [Trichinella pseudospiralis]|uniref:Uncharacterized protein n=1 Tax=Trichinella pseudospiralis TaxID=6337 RepID=A0A0V1JQW0_TRIPS|nr:hypothetical protein T4C_8985 [Trichinella pseudospiralis]
MCLNGARFREWLSQSIFCTTLISLQFTSSHTTGVTSDHQPLCKLIPCYSMYNEKIGFVPVGWIFTQLLLAVLMLDWPAPDVVNLTSSLCAVAWCSFSTCLTWTWMCMATNICHWKNLKLYPTQNF